MRSSRRCSMRCQCRDSCQCTVKRIMSATLPSNSGDKRFVITLGAPAEYAHDPGFESSINLFGCHWDGDHTFPFSTCIEGLWLRSADLFELHNHIARWSALPLDRLVASNLDAEFELARLPGQQVRICFGQRSDTIPESHHPVFSLNFSAGTFCGEFHFGTDQSCLGLFTRELSAELSRS